jgi:hypothetical protein
MGSFLSLLIEDSQPRMHWWLTLGKGERATPVQLENIERFGEHTYLVGDPDPGSYSYPIEASAPAWSYMVSSKQRLEFILGSTVNMTLMGTPSMMEV